MALSKQSAHDSHIVAFADIMKRAGFSVGEMYPYDAPNKGVHSSKSWHYDEFKHGGKRYSKAADINLRGGGYKERARFREFAIPVAESLGLGIIHARDGYVGAASAHRTHLHVDLGSYSNYGRGLVRCKAGGSTITYSIQIATRADVDNLWGDDTDKHAEAVRAASNWRGRKHPYGVEFLQACLGVNTDGVRGSKTDAAHDEAVAKIQRALGVTDDGIWGPNTDSAYLSARRSNKR